MTAKKHKPLRMCVGCRQVEEKSDLVRVVKTPDGVMIDDTGKLNGRGAYLHERKICWVKALSGSLAKSLQTHLSDPDLERLHAYKDSLPEEDQE